MNYMEELLRKQREMLGQDEPIQIPQAPMEDMQEAQSRASIAQSNQDMKSPNQKTKPEIVQDEIKQEASRTPAGQLNQIKQDEQQPTRAESLLSKIDSIRQQQAGALQSARETDRRNSLVDTVGKFLNSAAQSEIQRGAGQVINTKDVDIQKSPSEESKLLSRNKEQLKQLMDQYKLMQSDDLRMNPYQQAQINLKKRELDMKEKAPKKAAPKTKLQEEKEKLTAKRYDELQSSIPNRESQIEEANFLIDKLENDQLDTGPGSKLAGDIGSFFGTKESTLKQRLDSLAEKAARAQLKANGEVRPTDADVEGMKRAMFNMGNTEEANIEKLQQFIRQQQAGINEYGQMKEKLESGEGLEDFVLSNPLPAKKSTGKYGDTVERNGKTYKWNPAVGKYQPLR